MAFGSTYNNNQNQKQSPLDTLTTYSIRLNNAESKIDQTCLATKMWKNFLCLSIYPKKNTGNEEVVFDMDNGITIYLTPTKAYILKKEIEHFLDDPIKFNGSGTQAGNSVVTISNGIEYGQNTKVITIRRVDENGAVNASFAYEFRQNYHFSIRGYDGKNFTTVKDEYNDLEVQQLLILLDEYVKASTKAQAFAVRAEQVFTTNRVEDKINAIAQSLGVEIAKGGSSSGKRFDNTSFFRNAGNSNSDSYSGASISYGSATMEDLE